MHFYYVTSLNEMLTLHYIQKSYCAYLVSSCHGMQKHKQE